MDAKFQELCNIIQSLQQEIIELKKNQQISENFATNRPEPKIPLPEKFGGDKTKFRGFINQCQLIFALQPQRYSNDKLKIGFIISLLKDDALDWATPLLEQQNSENFQNFQEFLQEFQLVFDDPDRILTAERGLQQLKQKNRSTATYASEFRRLATDVTWNEPALIHQFYIGLSEEVKDELARVERPSAIKEMINLAIKIDNRLAERKQEKKYFGKNPNFSQNSRNFSFSPGNFRNLQQTLEPTPMQIDASFNRLSDEEKSRRKTNGLCLYCGNSGHRAQECPNKKFQGKDKVQSQ